MSENWKIQVSPKLADGTLINLRGESSEQIEAILNWAIDNAPLVQKAVAAFGGASNVAAALPVASVQQDGPSWSQQGSQQSAPAAPEGGGKKCAHGDMVYREGRSAKGPWRAYFCPTPKGTPNQCQPEFLRG